MRYAIEGRNQTFINAYRFLSFPKNIRKILEKNSVLIAVRNFLSILKNLLKMHWKLFQKINSETAEAIVNLISNTITDKITASRSAPETSSRTYENQYKYKKTIHFIKKENQQIIDELKLM